METNLNNQIITFGYASTELRTIKDNNGTVWFAAKDVCNVLGIKWQGSKSLLQLPQDWKWVVGKLPTTQKNQYSVGANALKDVIFITQPGVFKLAFRSNKEEADKFTNWVASEVLPAILKTGKYEIPKEILVAKPTQCLQALRSITNLGYKCIKELEQPLTANEQMHIFTKFINIAGLDFAQIQTHLQEHYKNEEAQSYYENNNYNPFIRKESKSMERLINRFNDDLY